MNLSTFFSLVIHSCPHNPQYLVGAVGGSSPESSDITIANSPPFESISF